LSERKKNFIIFFSGNSVRWLQSKTFVLAYVSAI
jgi:hypothetical protein